MKISRKFIEKIDTLTNSSLCDDLHNHSFVIDYNKIYKVDEKHEYKSSNRIILSKDVSVSEFNVPLSIFDSQNIYKYAIKSKIGYGNVYYNNGTGPDIIIGSMTNLVFYYQSNIPSSSTIYLNITNASNRMLGFEGNIFLYSLCLSCYSSGGILDIGRPVHLRNGSNIIASIYVPGATNNYFIGNLNLNMTINNPFFSAYVASSSNGPAISQVVLVLNFSIAAY
ncbi:MAG: hypothetical protein QXD03_04745 [Candidatus Anstonellales archaeon]